jgi:pro-apoptotic serine protease NMA111
MSGDLNALPPPPSMEPPVQILEYATLVDQDHNSLDPWGKVLQRVIKAVVTIKVNVLRTFDTHGAGRFEGTGFVVDRARGLILSNRHIVTQGPVIATATFGNYEEISLQQCYFDPVHDFGFFRYEPKDIKFAEVEEIELYPEGARVGLDIKVCGNDAGEKLSILSATLARLDRAAPFYGAGYSDFNINYLQAASGTTHGSSGSPVLDIQGRAVALNAGTSSISASGFYLPLEPIVRALKYIQQDQSVPRGTIQALFIHASYDELKRLGFPEEMERMCRERNKLQTGLLTTSRVLPEGPAYKSGLEVGDVLVSCASPEFGERFADGFHQVWEVIDGSIDKEITLTVYRANERKSMVVPVQDLQSITPNGFLEFGDGIFQQLSYQMAMCYHMPCKGVSAAMPGIFHWAGTGSLITELAGKPINCLQDLEETLLSLPDNVRVGFRYQVLGGRDEQYGIVEIDHHFYPCAKFIRSGSSWTRQILSPSPDIEPSKLVRAPTLDIQENRTEILKKLLVMIGCRVPYVVEVGSLLHDLRFRECLLLRTLVLGCLFQPPQNP